jgi:hypothetical protein
MYLQISFDRDEPQYVIVKNDLEDQVMTLYFQTY